MTTPRKQNLSRLPERRLFLWVILITSLILSWFRQLSWQMQQCCTLEEGEEKQQQQQQQQYWRHDDAAPTSLSGVSHFLKSIPTHYRLPPEAVDDLVGYFALYPDQAYPQRTYLFEYNPTVIRLPPDQREYPEDVYLASYRVTAFQYCFKSKAASHVFSIQEPYPDSAPPFEGLVALVVLQKDFSIRKEVIVDVSSIFPKFQDPRLFVLQGQLYLASYEYIVPFWLKDPPINLETRVLHDYWNASNNFVITVRTQPSCCTSPTCRGGKNFNYFATAHETWVETNPMQPRIVEHVDLHAPCSGERTTPPVAYYRDDQPPLPASFLTTDALILAGQTPYSEERGTACCISVLAPGGQTWNVGISHVKSKRVEGLEKVLTGRQYFSRLYAFEPAPPFRIVAVSGSFCLGFSSEDGDNYFQKAAYQQHFRMGEDLDCPKITFASGLTEHAFLSDRAILSYGINDCTGRIMVVDKKELVAMLVDPESRLN
jgi:hypothetical protein